MLVDKWDTKYFTYTQTTLYLHLIYTQTTPYLHPDYINIGKKSLDWGAAKISLLSCKFYYTG